MHAIAISPIWIASSRSEGASVSKVRRAKRRTSPGTRRSHRARRRLRGRLVALLTPQQIDVQQAICESLLLQRAEPLAPLAGKSGAPPCSVSEISAQITDESNNALPSSSTSVGNLLSGLSRSSERFGVSIATGVRAFDAVRDAGFVGAHHHLADEWRTRRPMQFHRVKNPRVRRGGRSRPQLN